jgi:hypothetical protein
MGRACSTHGEKKNAYGILVGKKGKRLLGSCRYRWDDNIKMDHRDMGCGGMDCIHLALGPVEGSCEHGNGSSVSIKCYEIPE